MFDNEFCVVKYLVDYNTVYLEWKKYACGIEYRRPTLYALELLQNNRNSNFIINAQNGFEDDEADVVWGFSELLPAMGRTTCTKCVMILNEVNDIEGEMDMWTAEFSKYFEVIHTTSVDKALHMVMK